MTNIIYIIIGLGGGVLLGLIIFWLNQRSKKLEENNKEDQSLLMIQNQIQEIVRTLDNKLGESTHMFQSQFGQSAQMIKEVTEKLTKLDETNKTSG